MVAQTVHAAGESAMGGNYPGVIHAVALAVSDEAELEKLEEGLALAGIPHKAVREPDEPWNGQLMAIGIEPTKDRSSIRRLTSRMPLLRAGSSTSEQPVSNRKVGGSTPSPRSISSGGSPVVSRPDNSKEKDDGSNPSLRTNTEVAQRVERPSLGVVGGSASLPLGAK
jgi:hypothetical protein